MDDVQETVNSTYVFDRIVETLGKKIIDSFLKDLHARLMLNTTMHQRGDVGVYKQILIISWNTESFNRDTCNGIYWFRNSVNHKMAIFKDMKVAIFQYTMLLDAY